MLYIAFEMPEVISFSVIQAVAAVFSVLLVIIMLIAAASCAAAALVISATIYFESSNIMYFEMGTPFIADSV